MKPRRRASVLVAMAASLTALAGAEVVLRLVAPVRTRFYELDPHAIYRPRAGAEQTFRYPHIDGGETVRLAFNSRGFRGEELQAPGAARRIVVYGDSFVEARLTPLERTFPERLEAYLAAATGAPVEAVNAGVNGYGPDQVTLRMEVELSALRPFLVVVVLYAGNDWGDLVRNALFRLDAAGQLVANEWRLDEPVRRGLAGDMGLRRLALVRAARSAWAEAQRRLARPEPGPQRGSIEWALRACERDYERSLREPARVGELFVDHYDADLSVAPRSASAAHKRRLMRAVVRRLRVTAAAAGVPLLAVLVPAPEDVCLRFLGRVDPTQHPGYRPSTLTDALEEIVRAEGIPFLNLFGTFYPDGDRLYYPIDGHWNAEAQDLAAGLATERIVEGGWVR